MKARCGAVSVFLSVYTACLLQVTLKAWGAASGLSDAEAADKEFCIKFITGVCFELWETLTLPLDVQGALQ